MVIGCHNGHKAGGVGWLGRNFLNALLTWHSTLGHRISLLNDPIFGSAGKNLKPPSTTCFLATKPQVAEARNWGLVGRSRVSPHFRNRITEVCGKFRNPRPQPPSNVKKPQVEVLPLSGVVNKSEICRILSEMACCQSSCLIGIIQFTPRYI